MFSQFILGRPIRFHDLAFFDPVIYESLRQLVVDAEKPGVEGGPSGSALQALDLTFSIDLCVEEGGGSVELLANGNLTLSPTQGYCIIFRSRYGSEQCQYLFIRQEVRGVPNGYLAGEGSEEGKVYTAVDLIISKF